MQQTVGNGLKQRRDVGERAAQPHFRLGHVSRVRGRRACARPSILPRPARVRVPFDLTRKPETMVWEERWHPLRREWVIVSSHRNDRPWLGETVDEATRRRRARTTRLLSLPGQHARLGTGAIPPTRSCLRLRQRSSVRRADCAGDAELRRRTSTRTAAPTAWRASSATRRDTTSRSPSCRMSEIVRAARDACRSSTASSARGPRCGTCSCSRTRARSSA